MSGQRRFLGWACASLLLCACAEDEQLVTANVPYQLGAGLNCAKANVVTLRAELGANGERTFEQPCDDSGQFVITGIEAGNWPLILKGINAQGAAIMGSSPQNQPTTVSISGQDSMIPPLTLANLPAKLLMRWDLGFGNCASLGIQDFQVGVWDLTEANELTTQVVPCAAAPVQGDYRQVPDPQGQINGASMKSMTVQARNNQGQNVGGLARLVLDGPPGPGYLVKASLKCESTGCTQLGNIEVSAQ